jgi:cytochrome c553
MQRLLDPLSDAYLRQIAAHFASLDLPYPPPQVASMPDAVRARAERLVREGDAALDVPACTRCHGDAMTGQQPSIPGLLGLPRDYLVAQLGAWRSGLRRTREPDCMAVIARRLSHDDVAVMATWLASQAPPTNVAAHAQVDAGALPIACAR